MRIAQLAPLFVRMPPTRYGGTERVVHALTEELTSRGNDVTLFAAGGTKTSATLHATSPAPLWEMNAKDPMAYRVLQVEEVIRRSAEFDVIHSHLDYLPWLAGDRLQAPLVTTMHSRLDLPELRPLLATMGGWPLISISNAQRTPVLDLDLTWIGTAYNGLNLAATYSLGEGDGGYLAFVGRIAPEKDPVSAIRVAIGAGLRLKIAARVDPIDAGYFERDVRPLLDHPLIEWIGEIDDDSKNELLGSARALLMPVDWDEPFGLVFIEALACGTPVISTPRGSLPEIVGDGVHGFLRTDLDGLVRACHEVAGLDRAACRQHVTARFSTERMADAYERAYEVVIEGGALVA
jgi:glycosyltransferase involved in cell wall biosynthesis